MDDEFAAAGDDWPDDDVAVRAERRGTDVAILSFRVRWEGHTPTPRWVEVALLYEPSDEEVAAALVAAERKRRKSFRRCAFCHERVAPELGNARQGVFACHGCQERHLGVVH